MSKGSKWRTTNFRKYRGNWPLNNPKRELHKDEGLPICWFCGGRGKTEMNKNGDVYDPCPVCRGSGRAMSAKLSKIEYERKPRTNLLSPEEAAAKIRAIAQKRPGFLIP